MKATDPYPQPPHGNHRVFAIALVVFFVVMLTACVLGEAGVFRH